MKEGGKGERGLKEEKEDDKEEINFIWMKLKYFLYLRLSVG